MDGLCFDVLSSAFGVDVAAWRNTLSRAPKSEQAFRHIGANPRRSCNGAGVQDPLDGASPNPGEPSGPTPFAAAKLTRILPSRHGQKGSPPADRSGCVI